MHREEVVTLARTTSQQNAANKANGGLKSNTTSTNASPQPPTMSPHTTSHAAPLKSIPQSPQRRHFVFADPVAFRYLLYLVSTLAFANHD